MARKPTLWSPEEEARQDRERIRALARARAVEFVAAAPEPASDTPPAPRYQTPDGDEHEERPDGLAVPMCDLRCPWWQSSRRRDAGRIYAGLEPVLQPSDFCALGRRDLGNVEICWPALGAPAESDNQ